MKKFFYLSTLLLVMLVTLLPMNVKAQTDVWDGSAVQWTQGSGTQTDPYLIETAENLAWIAEMVNSGVTTYAGKYFKLVSDLNMNSIAWVPIGNSTTQLFCGKFDGDHHFINNISITGSYDYRGLFGITGNGFRCKNLGVYTTTSPSSGQYCGGIVGYINGNNTVIEKCYNNGSVSNYIITNYPTSPSTSTISTYSYSGGIVGYVNGAGTRITDCHNSGSVYSNCWTRTSTSYTYSKSYSYSGGIVGYVNGTSTSIADCYNMGSVSSVSNAYSTSYSTYSYSYSGGIVGYVNGTGTSIADCYNKGSVSNTSSSSNSNNYNSPSYSYSGGIVGYGYNEAITTLNRCYNKSTITATSQGQISSSQAYSGGLVGYSGKINLSNSYNRGKASAYCSHNTTMSGTCQVGGVIGYIDNSSSSIANCYNTGTLTGGTKGGIRGNTTGSVSNCYYLETCGGTVNGGTSKTETAMKSSSFPILLNADSTVFVMDITPNVNDGYPIFGNSSIYLFTEEADNINFFSASLHGVYYPENVDVVGFEYKDSTAVNYTTVYTNVGTPVSYNLTGLQSGTNYQYRMFVQKDGVTYYGDIVNFSTLQCNVTAEVQTASTGICMGDTATLTAIATSPMSDAFTYLWSTQNTTATITATAAGTYTVTVTDGNGCTATANSTITVNPLPTGTIIGNTVLCVGQSTTLTASGANRYNWSTGASSPIITVNTSGTYTCTFTNSYNCSMTQSVEVSVLDAPTISGNLNICEGGSTMLTASGGNSYVWSDGSNTPSITVNNAGVYTVTATSGNCTATASVTTSIVPIPQVTISGNTIICNGVSATLTASSGSSYLWSTGGTTPFISVNSPGTYSVTVTNSNGCSNSATQTVSLMEPTTLSGDSHICSGESTTLTATGTGSYQWSNGSNTPSITVNTPGTYSVTTSLPNGCSSSATIEVTVASLPTPLISGSNVLCKGQSTTLTATGGNSYSWSNGSTQNSIVVTQSGNYTVTVTNTDGCSASTSIMVTVNPLPNVTISGNSSFCQGDNVTLTATGANSYAWSNASSNAMITVNSAGTYTVIGTDVNGCTNTAFRTVSVNPTYNIPLTHSICEGESYNFYGQNLTSAGIYTHTLQTINGCDSVLTLTLTVKSLPMPSITGNTSICEGQSTTLTATGGNSYSWSNGSTQNSIVVTQSGNYTVSVTNTDGCSASTSTTVTVNPLPNVTISGNNSFCQGDNVTLTATGASSYVWSNASSNAAITVNNAGTYTVIGTDVSGCTNTASQTVAVNPTYNTPLTHSICEGENYNFYGQNLTSAGTYTHTLQTINGCDSVLTLTLTVKSLPTPSITGNTSICEGQSTTLTATGGNSYSWSNGSTQNSIIVTQSGNYTVTVTNADGCSASTSTTVTVNPLPTVTISGNTTVCQGSSTTLTASGADSYIWSTGENTASVNISSFGIYTVTGTSAEGCSNTANVTVLVSQLPVITITGETDFCAGESTTLTANGGETYLWNDGTTDAEFTVNIAGTYQVIGYNAAGCYNMESVTVNQWQPASSEFTITTDEDCYEWNGQSYCQTGDYTQTFQTIHGCDSVVTLHLTIETGIDNYAMNANMNIYPNPTSDVVNVQLTMNNEQLGNVTIQVYDVFGKMLDMVNVGNSDAMNRVPTGHSMDSYGGVTNVHGLSAQIIQIDLSRYANGVYFIKAVSEGNVLAVRKVVKN